MKEVSGQERYTVKGAFWSKVGIIALRAVEEVSHLYLQLVRCEFALAIGVPTKRYR